MSASLSVVMDMAPAHSTQYTVSDEICEEIEIKQLAENNSASIQAILLNEAEALKNLNEGADYVESQAFFLANNRKEAKNIAESYHATLDSFEDGVAVIRFNETLAQALGSAATQNNLQVPVYPDYTVKICASETDPYFENGWQWFHGKIGDQEAHAKGITGKGVKVAIIDTGIAYWHEDLAHCYAGGYDFRNKDKDPADDNGHGTHCAGIIAAEKGNGKGGSGIAPDVSIYAYKAFNNLGFGNMSDDLKALNRAVKDGVDIISMSYCTQYYNEAYQTAINNARKKGIVLVAAAGNRASDEVMYPANYEGVIAVGASAPGDGNLASYSNYGDWVDITAPGGADATSTLWPVEDGSNCKTEILSSYHENESGEKTSAYACMRGTSMACPMVAATAALIKSANPMFKEKSIETSTKITELILGTKDSMTYSSAEGSVIGGLQAGAAVERALSMDPAEFVRILNPYGFPVSCNIAVGTSMQLKLKNLSGTVTKNSGKASWFSDNQNITIGMKTGKVSTKYAKSGESALITATMPDGQSYYYTVTTVPKYKRFGVWQKKMLACDDEEVVMRNKNYPSQDVYVKCGTMINLSNPYELLQNYGDLELLEYYEPQKEGYISYAGQAADSSKQYQITVSKKMLSCISIYSKQDNGDPENISFQYPGTYSIKYKTTDGSNRQFTTRFIVVNN